jgi:hypothetical protein
MSVNGISATSTSQVDPSFADRRQKLEALGTAQQSTDPSGTQQTSAATRPHKHRGHHHHGGGSTPPATPVASIQTPGQTPGIGTNVKGIA